LRQRNDEFEGTRLEIREFEASIEENERIRESIEKRIEEIAAERTAIQVVFGYDHHKK
jgi:chromosome segregation ATPase